MPDLRHFVRGLVDDTNLKLDSALDEFDDALSRLAAISKEVRVRVLGS